MWWPRSSALWGAGLLSCVMALTTARAEPLPTERQMSLSAIMGSTAPLRLRGVEGEAGVSLPLPPNWTVQQLRLRLRATASSALTTGSLAVSVNGHVVGQVPLDGRSPRVEADLDVPPDVLRHGYNDVRLQAVQHHTDRCEYPLAPELWTDVDLTGSSFSVKHTLTAPPTRLDRLEDLFSRLTWAPRVVLPVLTPRPASVEMLTALNLVAQGVGQRLDYVPVQLRTGRLPPGLASLATSLPADAPGIIVAGRFADLASVLPPNVPRNRGPIVSLQHVPGDDTRFMVVFAAETEQDLRLAAAAFAMPAMPWPDTPWAAVASIRMPPLGSVTGVAASLKPSTQAYPLSALGYRTATLKGLQSGGTTLRLWHDAWQGRIQTRVHASYTAGMAPQSALNIVANGVVHGSIPLSEPAGGSYDNYAVSLPAGALRPGWNTLSFEPALVPQTRGGECQPFFPGNLAVTVYDDSTIQTFGGSPMRRPDLALLAQSGRPTPGAPVGVGMAVQLAAGDDATVGAAMTLMAKLTQVFKGPLLRTQMAIGPVEGVRHGIWVGALGQLPAAVRDAAGIGSEGELVDAVPLIQSSSVAVLEGGDTLQALRRHIEDFDAAPSVLSAGVTLRPGPSSHALAATALVRDAPMTVFTAPTPATLEAAIGTLVAHGPWSQLKGDRATWRPGEETVQTHSAEDAPFTAYSLRGGLGLWISQYPWTSLFLLIVLLALLVWFTRKALDIYRRRHLPPQPAQRRDDGARS